MLWKWCHCLSHTCSQALFITDVLESYTPTNNHTIMQSGCSLIFPQITCTYTLAPVNSSIRIWILITEVVNALNKFELILPFSFAISMILRYLILTCWQYWLAHTIKGKSLQFISAKLIMFETCNLASWLAKKDLRFAPKNFVSNRWKTAPRNVNFTKKKKKDYSHKHFWPIFNIWFISWKWYHGTRVATIKQLLLISLYQ